MKGDFTRDTFDPAKHFSRVLLQQGRVQLDADWNEQAAILLHYMQTLAADLIGPHAGPDGDHGFEITKKESDEDLVIGKGHYYVDGLLCENGTECSYSEQPDYPLLSDGSIDLDKWLGKGSNCVAYLDVWERHLTHLDNGLIREVALGGPDTATRAKVVWQVRVMFAESCDGADESLRSGADMENRAKMKARLDPENINPNPCITAPDSKYRGAENQLYRVEIHDSSTDKDGNTSWTFKWSRENGSIVAAWLGNTDDGGLIVSSTRGFKKKEWVEITSDMDELHNTPGQLTKIEKVDGDALTFDPPLNIEWKKDVLVKFRRWDQSEVGDVVLAGGAVPGAIGQWLDLEHGIQVWFASKGDFRSGDYWLIPARVATGQIEWPTVLDGNGKVDATLLAPRGIQHHYAPLAILTPDGALNPSDCRCTISPIERCEDDR